MAASESNDGIEKTVVNVLTETRFLPVQQCRQDSDRGIHCCQDVNHRQANFEWAATRRTIRMAGNTHQTANRLKDEIIAGLVSIGSRLAVGSNGAVDKSPVDFRKGRIVEAISCKSSDLVILNKHIALGDETFYELLPFGR